METIAKEGTVIAVKDGCVKVKFLSCSACNNCQAKGFCGMSESADKLITVPIPDDRIFKIGEEVSLTVSAYQGLKAVVFCYAVPLLLLLAAVISASLSGFDDFYSGICGIFILIPYYLGVFLLKNKISRKFRFEISKKAHS